MAVRPFPYASLPKLTRQQSQLLAALRTYWVRGDGERALNAASDLLGRELSCQLGLGDRCSAAELRARCASTAAIAVSFEQPQLGRPILCALELSHQGAQQLVDLALGGDAESASAGIVQLDELSRGALAYLAARMLSAHGGGWSLRNVSELAQLEAAIVDDCVVYPLTARLGPVLLQVRAYIPERLALQDRPQRPAVRDLHALRVSLRASAGYARLPASTLRELGRGDVIVLDESDLTRDGDRWRGQVRAGLSGSRHHLHCAIEEQALCVLGYAHQEELNVTQGTIIDKAGETAAEGAAASDLAADAPIELQVEVARFSVSLGELQRLQAGDVLTTGRKIGERVHLQVGGQSFAEGELVDVEGEVGVRLLRFAGEP